MKTLFFLKPTYQFFTVEKEEENEGDDRKDWLPRICLNKINTDKNPYFMRDVRYLTLHPEKT